MVGDEGRGLEYMFIMMNAARFAVGVEGVGLCERAYQRALSYARERVQGAEIGGGRGKVAIIRHPDVRRMLMLMRTRTQALRAVAVDVAAAMDEAAAHTDEHVRAQRQAYVDLMIPVVKGWSTESAVEITSLGVQIHGGMGYIEETGAAQHFRDARITTIYEGTSGIQALDLVGRKIARDGGNAVQALIARMSQTRDLLADSSQESGFTALYSASLTALQRAVGHVVDSFGKNPRQVAACSYPMLELLGIVSGGWMMARTILAAHQALRNAGADAAFLEGKIAGARFYAHHVLVRADGLSATVIQGADAVLAMTDNQF
jgi:hypothetical protein